MISPALDKEGHGSRTKTLGLFISYGAVSTLLSQVTDYNLGLLFEPDGNKATER